MLKSLSVASLIVLCMVFIFISVGACHAAPKVQVDQAMYDAGSVSEGKDASHEFIFRNAGNQDLTIKPKPC